MNILITSSSAKVLLVKEFVKVTSKYGYKTLTSDLSNDVATAFVSDKHIILPKTNDTKFVEVLTHYCMKEKIGAIIPTRDGELSTMASIKEMFAKHYGVTIIVPSEQSVNICTDKKMFTLFLEKNNFGSIPIIDKNNISLPAFARPRVGSSSEGARKIETTEQLATVDNNFIIHPFIDENEYSVDVLMDTKGNALQAVCRQRINVVSGESKISIVKNIPELEQCAMRLGEALGLVGHNVIQSFYSEKNGISIIEANLRFGGASNLSVRAGLNSPLRLFQMLLGDDAALANSRIKYGLTMYRYSEDIFCETDCT